jgi:outer membrane protein
MVASSRKIVAIGLGLAGLACLVAPSLGQPQQGDAAVRKTANPNPAQNGPKPPIAPVIGTVDLDFIFKNYEKVKVTEREFAEAIKIRRGDLMKLENDARQEAEMMKNMTPGSEDFRKHENKITDLKAKMEAQREQAEREFTLRNAERMATLYKEVQTAVGRVAQWRGMTYIIKVSNAPISGSDPNTVMAAMYQSVLYADPRNDISNDVVHYLNRWYQAVATPAQKPGSRISGGAAAGKAAPDQ